MAKKNTAKYTEIRKDPLPVYEYVVGYQFNDKVICETFRATSVEPDNDELQLFAEIDGNEIQVGAYRDWKFYRMVTDRELFG